MYILKLVFKQDCRCFKKGLAIDFKPITLLVGDQGTGKSTILECVHQQGQGKDGVIELGLSDVVKEKSVTSYYFDAEKHNPRLQDPQFYTEPSGRDRGIGFTAAVTSRFRSHGEVLSCFTVEPILQAKNCIVLLDEPESALSVRNQFRLAKNVQTVAPSVQFIIATHCLPLIQSVESVFSLNHLEWMSSKDFVDSQME
jgi:predicted ATPase